MAFTNEQRKDYNHSQNCVSKHPFTYTGEPYDRPKTGDVEGWLMCYLKEAYPFPFGDVHRDIITQTIDCLKTGNPIVIAAPRETGKSTVINGVTLYAVLEGLCTFPVVIPWSQRATKRALNFWKVNLCYNAKLHNDYPEHTDVFRISQGVSQKIPSLTDENGNPTGAQLLVTEGIIVLPRSKGLIGSASVNGNPRGIQYTTINGEVLRPKAALIDDPQDKKTAKNPVRVRETLEKIDGDIASLGKMMPIVATVTVISKDDVADSLLHRDDWKVIRVPRITSWPTGFNEIVNGQKSALRQKWDAFDEIRKRDGNPACVAFYIAHKDELIKGMKISWANRSDSIKWMPDEFCGAMLDYYRLGRGAFMAEMQNEPMSDIEKAYALTPQLIMSRVDPLRKQGEIPDWGIRTVCATDVNPSYGYTSVIESYGLGQKAAVVSKFIFNVEDRPDLKTCQDMAKPESDNRIKEALTEVGRKIKLSSINIDVWGIDAGGSNFDAVLEFCQNSVTLCGIQATAIRGGGDGKSGYRKSKTSTGIIYEQGDERRDHRKIKWLVFNKGYWQEVSQKMWFAPIGSNGSCSLYDGQWADFAEQCSAEYLETKIEMQNETIYRFHQTTAPHDFGDCHYMCAFLASVKGVGTSGTVQSHTRERRKYSSADLRARYS
jgi:hypothetical protein